LPPHRRTRPQVSCGRGRPRWRLVVAALLLLAFGHSEACDDLVVFSSSAGQNYMDWDGATWEKTAIANGKPVYTWISGGASWLSYAPYHLFYYSGNWRVTRVSYGTQTYQNWLFAPSTSATALGVTGWNSYSPANGWGAVAIYITSACPPPPPIPPAQPPAPPPSPPPSPPPMKTILVSPGHGTLQAAHDSAAERDELVLASGVYTGNESFVESHAYYTGPGDYKTRWAVVRIRKSITIRAAVAGGAVLNASGQEHVISITRSSEGGALTVRLEGLDVTGSTRVTRPPPPSSWCLLCSPSCSVHGAMLHAAAP
jgi:hypothetical protein